ncbi:PIN-like domain-containing protein [Methylobacterium sp. J-092]|uniref:PIN-like domain-containing protein n=1 Tax=Methylobacterium sp. J-092 TaxID=2836667 RepID=UPI001FBB3F9D|nr:PIN-like domain-containing protein [Methylobacterium sp. J-092]MCJ2009846.1 PIN-like domain-containing protein [Methylobacterium sp. J-092]
MRDKYPEFDPPTAEEIEDLWQSAFIVPDSSALLSLFEYEATAAAEIILAFEALRDRLFLLHQVGIEFYRNHERVKEGGAKQFGTVLSYINKLEETLLAPSNSIEGKIKNPLLDLKKYKDELKRTIASLRDMHKNDLDEYENKAKQEHVLILRKIEGLFGQHVKTQLDIDKVSIAAERRFNLRIPPGYMDKDKGKNNFGDLVVWFEMIALSGHLRMPIIFITNDEKEDWWATKGAIVEMPRPELIKEFRSKTGKNFWMYKLRAFLEVAHARKLINIKGSTLTEIKNKDIDSKKQRLERLKNFLAVYEVKSAEASAKFYASLGDDSNNSGELHHKKANLEYLVDNARTDIRYTQDYIEAMMADEEPSGQEKYFNGRRTNPISDNMLLHPELD